jgi:hypothetical protein
MSAAIVLIVGILVLMLLFWVLKIAFKLVLIGVVVVVALAAWTALKKRIGGPHA